MPRKKAKKRPMKTQISISLPTKLVDRIDALADNENRNRSNFISNAIAEMIEKQLEEEENE